MAEYPRFSEYPTPPTEVPNSSTAVISLVSGILGLTFLPFIGSVVALITGRMAKREIDYSGGTLGGERMAQVGILLGWIGIGLAAVGLCVTGVMIAIPLCLVALGLSSGEWGTLYPMVLLFL